MRLMRHSPIGMAGLLLVATLPLLMAQGCPPQNNQNTPPTANAGNDRTVGFGDSVTLNANGSSDVDGDTLSFAWAQTSGTNVNLSGTGTATPSFTAPNNAETLTFQVTVGDGNGGSDTDTVDVVVAQQGQAPASPTLFITSFNGDNVVAYDITNPQAINGNIAPDANLQGVQTQLNFPADAIVDAGGALLVANLNTPSITGYDNASDLSGVNGNVAPSRNVQGAATLLVSPTSLAVSTANDLAFVSDQNANAVFVFANASTAGFNGNLAPTRTITSADISVPVGINFGANDELYVANNTTNTVSVFANASNLNGNVAATRVITNAAFVDTIDVFVDGGDTLFVLDRTGFLSIFNNASTLNGAVNPDFTLTVQGAVQLLAVVVDSNGVGYITDEVANAVYSYDNIATRNGTAAPDRTLQGANTQLNGAGRLFLLE